MAALKGNKYALGNTGKPPIYDSAESLAAKINEYFEQCIEDEEKVTITGLTLYVGFCSRTSLGDYGKKGEEYMHIIKRAKLAVEYSYEMGGQTIDIFALKNMGWKDNHGIEFPNGLPVINLVKGK